MEKKKRRNKSDYGDDFVAPDGGWGWLVCIASGISNLSTIIIIQTFGLIFGNKMLEIGLTNSEITTISNTQTALCACTGLLNGRVFRRFSYRQVAITGSIIASSALFLTSFANSFAAFFIFYSIFFGLGMGISTSSSGLVLNTYFKVRRPRAASIAWTIVGLGSIIIPFIIPLSLSEFGYQGTVMIFSGLSLHTLPCALILQPVLWHVKKSSKDNKIDSQLSSKTEINSVISSNGNENIKTECENNNTKKNSLLAGSNDGEVSEIEIKPKRTWCQRLTKYFDLDLFKDYTFVNILVGMTLSTFTGTNFSVLTPFFLSDFGYSIEQITLVMSVLAATDVALVFLLPYFLEHLKWKSITFFMIGTTLMVVVRTLIALIPSYEVLIVWFVLMGVARALRTIFYDLVIADHVPLKRLPAASGLRLIFSGVFTLCCGPLVGLIRDATNYSTTIHILNSLTLVAVITWTIEIIYKKCQERNRNLELS